MTDNERAEYERRIEELLDALQRHVAFGCETPDGAVSANMNWNGHYLSSIRILIRCGRLTVIESSDTYFRGRWIPVADRKPLPAPVRDPESDADRRFGRFLGERYELPRGSC